MSKRLTVNISGMSPLYEEACQKLLLMGLNFIKGKDKNIWDNMKDVYEVKKNIIFNDLMSSFNKIDCSGAQVSAVLAHLVFIHRHGYDNWISKGRESREDRVYEIEVE